MKTQDQIDKEQEQFANDIITLAMQRGFLDSMLLNAVCHVAVATMHHRCPTQASALIEVTKVTDRIKSALMERYDRVSGSSKIIVPQ